MVNNAKVARAICYNTRQKVRIALGLKSRQPKWLPRSFDATVEHHADLASFLLKDLTAEWNLAGRTACEVGRPACFGIAGVLIQIGGRHVDLIKTTPRFSTLSSPRYSVK